MVRSLASAVFVVLLMSGFAANAQESFTVTVTPTPYWLETVGGSAQTFSSEQGDSILLTLLDEDADGEPDGFRLAVGGFGGLSLTLEAEGPIGVGTYVFDHRSEPDTVNGNVSSTLYQLFSCPQTFGQITITEFERNGLQPVRVVMSIKSACFSLLDRDASLDIQLTYASGSGDGDGGGDDDDGNPPAPPVPFRVSFGSEAIPPPTSIGLSGTENVTFTSTVDDGFSSDLYFSATSDATEFEDFHVSIEPSMLPAPGIGEGVLKIQTGPNTFPRTYQVFVHVSNGVQVSTRSLLITVECTPPTILGINQPVGVSKNVGETVVFKVVPSGTGPFTYQWYRGMRGMTRNPVAAEHFDTLDFTATQNGYYWVRVSNACGTVDSNSVYLSTNGEGPIRRR